VRWRQGKCSAPLAHTMAGGGWVHLASAAKELAGVTGSKAKAVGQTLGKAVVRVMVVKAPSLL
jgi:hypothetical protein